jgi:nicotinate-nucleotide adenylyltransferase
VRTGILGGTFDPIHIAHLHAGEVSLHQARLDRILFMPAGSPWQKSGNEVSAGEHRLVMTRLAADDYEGFQVDDREVLRDGPTYTADTLETFPDDEEVFLILGADAASRLRTWERHEAVLARSTVLVVPRPGTDIDLVSRELPESIILDMPALEVSGTHIRRMAREHRPYRFLVVEPVHDYIEEHQLYTQSGGGDNVGVPERLEKSS